MLILFFIGQFFFCGRECHPRSIITSAFRVSFNNVHFSTVCTILWVYRETTLDDALDVSVHTLCLDSLSIVASHIIAITAECCFTCKVGKCFWVQVCEVPSFSSFCCSWHASLTRTFNHFHLVIFPLSLFMTHCNPCSNNSFKICTE